MKIRLNGPCDNCGAVCVNLTPKGDLPRGPYDEVLMDRLICDSCLDAELKAEAVQDVPVQAAYDTSLDPISPNFQPHRWFEVTPTEADYQLAYTQLRGHTDARPGGAEWWVLIRAAAVEIASKRGE